MTAVIEYPRRMVARRIVEGAVLWPIIGALLVVVGAYKAWVAIRWVWQRITARDPLVLGAVGLIVLAATLRWAGNVGGCV